MVLNCTFNFSSGPDVSPVPTGRPVIVLFGDLSSLNFNEWVLVQKTARFLGRHQFLGRGSRIRGPIGALNALLTFECYFCPVLGKITQKVQLSRFQMGSACEVLAQHRKWITGHFYFFRHLPPPRISRPGHAHFLRVNCQKLMKKCSDRKYSYNMICSPTEMLSGDIIFFRLQFHGSEILPLCGIFPP